MLYWKKTSKRFKKDVFNLKFFNRKDPLNRHSLSALVAVDSDQNKFHKASQKTNEDLQELRECLDLASRRKKHNETHVNCTQRKEKTMSPIQYHRSRPAQ